MSHPHAGHHHGPGHSHAPSNLSARTMGAAVSPLFVGFFFARPALISLPFFIAGTLKILYDLLLYRAFVKVQPPEEARP